jgi:[ribosomal protein S5]-alanine N-acetyltransferase
MTVLPIQTVRLELVSLSSHIIDAILAGRRKEAERLAGLRLPENWPDDLDARFLRMRVGQLRSNLDWQEWLVRAIVPRAGERSMVGHIGFHGPPDAIGRAEMGYTVLPQFRRQGYATEAAQAMIDWARVQHGVTHFYLSIAPTNEPSLAMAAKLGFKQVGEQIDEEDGLELVFELVLG